MNSEIAGEVMRAAPPVVATGLTLWGLTLDQWLIMATIAYTVLQAHFLMYEKAKWYKRFGDYVWCKARSIMFFVLRRKNVTGSKRK